MAKKIGAIVSLSIIGILIIATIIMANVNIDYSINCAKPTSIWIQKGVQAETLVQSTSDYNKIVDLIEDASKEKSLTALFNGNIGKEAKIVASNKTIPDAANFYVRYSYEAKQKLMIDKDEYKDSNGSLVYYEELVFTVNNLPGSNVVNVYVIPDATYPKAYTHYYELEADFTELYAFLNEKY